MWTDNVSANLPNNQGYMVSLGKIHYDAANAKLYAGSYAMDLFIREYRVSFVLQGSTGQAQLQRDFYPRNFQQASFVISGESPNQNYYNLLGEFVHYGQRKAVTTGKPMALEVHTSGTPSVRGADQGFLAEGYIDQMERGAAFGEFAPDYDFNFIVSNMLEGLYDEDPVKIRKLKSWAEIMKDLPSNTWVTDPDAKDNEESIGEQIRDFVFGEGGTGSGGLQSYWEWLQSLRGGKG